MRLVTPTGTCWTTEELRKHCDCKWLKFVPVGDFYAVCDEEGVLADKPFNDKFGYFAVYHYPHHTHLQYLRGIVLLVNQKSVV